MRDGHNRDQQVDEGEVSALSYCVILAAFLFLDWRTMLQKRKLAFNFRIWKRVSASK